MDHLFNMGNMDPVHFTQNSSFYSSFSNLKKKIEFQFQTAVKLFLDKSAQILVDLVPNPLQHVSVCAKQVLNTKACLAELIQLPTYVRILP